MAMFLAELIFAADRDKIRIKLGAERRCRDGQVEGGSIIVMPRD